jgi:hypothetical protein
VGLPDCCPRGLVGLGGYKGSRRSGAYGASYSVASDDSGEGEDVGMHVQVQVQRQSHTHSAAALQRTKLTEGAAGLVAAGWLMAGLWPGVDEETGAVSPPAISLPLQA